MGQNPQFPQTGPTTKPLAPRGTPTMLHYTPRTDLEPWEKKVETEVAQYFSAIEAAEEHIQHTVMRLTKESRANWITVGLFVGIFLSALFSQLPWWVALFAFAGIIGMLQWLSRQSWDFVRRWIENRKSSSAKAGANDARMIRNNFLEKSSSIAYRYCLDLAQKARDTFKLWQRG